MKRTNNNPYSSLTQSFALLMLVFLLSSLQTSALAADPSLLSNEMAAPASPEALEPVTGTTITVQKAGSVTWDEMLEYEAKQPKTDKKPTVVPFIELPLPLEIDAGGGRPQPLPEPAPPEPFAGPGLIDNFQGLDDNNTSIPPDTHGAAGPNHLVVMLNTQVRIQSKSGTTINTVTLDTFWTGGTGLSGDPFDPKVIYDSLSDRWMATVDADARLASSAVWFAISDTSDPTGTWDFYGFDADGTDTYWADYPGFGVNSTWIAITNNMFTNAGPPYSFIGADMWVIDKSTALGGGPLTMTQFGIGFDIAGGAFGSVLKPALTFDAAESDLYIVDGNTFSSGGTQLHRLSRITGTGPAPVWSVLAGSIFGPNGLFFTTETYNSTQIDAEQSGTTTDVNTNDPRLLNAVFRNGSIWTTHSAGYPRPGPVDRTVAVWYEIDPTGMPTPIVQSGVIAGGVNTHYFFPSITANINNDAVLGFSYSDGSQFVEAAYTGRESGDTPGTMGTVTTCKAGEDSYEKDFGSGRVRWGDYSATVVDPSDDTTFWTLQEYAETDVGGGASDDRWGTHWCRVIHENVWEGDTSTSWGTASNWSQGTAPTCSTDAVIPITPLGGPFPTVDSDVEVRNLDILSGATINMTANTLGVCGDLTNDGTTNFTGGTVDFKGGTAQNLTANVATTFFNLTTSSGTTLVETVATDNVTVNGTLTNAGTLRKTKSSLATGVTTFGVTGASVDISTLGNLSSLQVDRVGSAHPDENANGGGADILDTYYDLSPDASDQSFTLEVCLGYTDAELAASPAVSSEANLRLCRWTGSSWGCPNRSGSSDTGANLVCAAGVNTLSAWTIGEVSPTDVTLNKLRSGSESSGLPYIWISIGVLFIGAALIFRRVRVRLRAEK